MPVSPQMRECIARCQSCHSVCSETITYCLRQGGPHAEPDHIRLMLDCVEICQTSANFMLRGSDLHPLTCGACAEICERCAEDCDRMGEDETMRRCVDECRRCAESCRRMAEQAVLARAA
jgi:hypothetical protein